ncbi:hypothetical protein V6U90_16530 [Micromonospora sp. CPCC 206060]|uniref:hypothetical protein n=1 Tax=Micromonospora sp. CPCC 206060 TaxID=3122406 RepID=UPI002FF15C05
MEDHPMWGALPWLHRCYDRIASVPSRGDGGAGRGERTNLSWSRAKDLAAAMLDYARWSGDEDRLDCAIALLRYARSIAPSAGPPRRIIATQLGLALYVRFQRRGSRTDLDAAVAELCRGRGPLDDSEATGNEVPTSEVRLLTEALRHQVQADEHPLDRELATTPVRHTAA